ncbi:MAG: hypothetical protein ACYC9O_19675 [Candidatus Latescibacterota bacterium]
MHESRKLPVTDKVATVPNPAIDAGIPLPNFSDGFLGNGPDPGAFERGNPPLKFGRHVGVSVVYAPWEMRKRTWAAPCIMMQPAFYRKSNVDDKGTARCVW